MHRITAGLAATALVCVCHAQDIACEKFRLPNGMTVILHEDHSLPIATINTWFRVGAQDEPPGRSGFAHLFEHLMFMGTARVPGNKFDTLMEAGGGANNASTDLHRTNYFSWGPSKLLPTLLWLDADRLEDMGLNMSQEKLDKQRDVVRNELRQTVENSPYGKAGEMVNKLMYTPDHPYYYGVIGTHEDLEAANVTNVKDFFATFYVPSNACLVVAGDFDSAKIKPLVSDLFGTIPGGAAVTRKYEAPREPIPVRLKGVKRFTSIDKVELPKVQYNYHSPRAFAEGDADMDLVAAVLASGKSSRLYTRLVMEEKLATEVSANQAGFPLGGIFSIDVLCKPDADLGRVEGVLDEELGKLLKDGVTAAELAREQARVELGKLSSLQSVQARADKMNEYEYYWGEPNSFKRDLDRYRNATTQSLATWAKQVVTQDARVVMHVLPEEPQRGASARDTRPGDSDGRAFAPPSAATVPLGNGLTVKVFERHNLPLVSMLLVSKPGGGVDRSGQEGLASLAMAMLSEGAGDLDSVAFANAVQSLGGSFGAEADTESVSVSMTVLKRNLGKAAPLFADALLRPKFAKEDFERVKGLQLDDLRQALTEPRATAARVADKILFAAENPYATPVDGTVKSVSGLTLDDAKGAYRDRLLLPQACTLYVAGDITAEEVKSVFSPLLAEWKGGGAAAAAGSTDFGFAPASSMRFVIVDRPGATQTMVRFAAPGVKYDSKDRVERMLLNTILGGSFTSRLNQNLREDHGYTYGAKSSFSMDPSTGTFNAGAAVQAQVTGPALAEFLKEFGRLRGGDISDEESGKARETVRNETVRSFAGLGGLLNTAAALQVSGLSPETIAQDLNRIEAIKTGDLNALAAGAIALDRGVLVLVGDKGVILEQLKSVSGLPAPSFCDPEGNPISQ